MSKLRFDRFMVTDTTNRIFSSNKEQTVLETSRIYFIDNSYGFTHDVSEYDTKLNLQEKTYEISEEQKHQMDLAVITISEQTLQFLRIAVEGPHITLYDQSVLSTKEHTTTEITQAVYQYLKKGYVLTRIPLDKSSYWKEQIKQI